MFEGSPGTFEVSDTTGEASKALHEASEKVFEGSNATHEASDGFGEPPVNYSTIYKPKSNNMATPHCSLKYHEFGVLKLETFADGVRKGIYENDPPFTAPPLTEAQLTQLIENYHHRYDDYKNGGKLKKPAYLTAKAALIKGLDDTATFVDALPGVDENMITLAGYTPTKTTDSDAQVPATPGGAVISRGAAGELFAEVPKVDGADYYGCLVFARMPMPAQIAFNAAGQLVVTAGDTPEPNPNPTPEPHGQFAFFDVTKARKKRFTGLQSGVTYYFYFYAANTAGVSLLSEGRSLICG